jgi:uncharacterized protein YndB with AHSA1/START domain
VQPAISVMNATGTITVEGEVSTLTFIRRLRHPVQAVWAALTEPAQRAEWFGPSRVEPRVGGDVETDPQGPPVPPAMKLMTGKVLVWDPPHVFEHEHNQTIVGKGVVRYELKPDGDGTILTFTHRGLIPKDAFGFIPGTHAYLDRLQAHLDGASLPEWQARFAEVAPLYT